MKTIHFVLGFFLLLGAAILGAALIFPVLPVLGAQAPEKPSLVFEDSVSQGADITVYQPVQSSPVWFNGNVFDYGSGFALVKETQSFALQSGLNELQVSGLPKHVNPASVFFRDVTDTNARLVEQNYLFDVVSRARMLQKYLGETIAVDFGNETVTGKLLSSDDGLLLQTSSGVQAISDYSRISFPKTQETLLLTPTLQWLVRTDRAGSHEIEYAYLASGLSWSADYVALVNADDSRASLQGWASVRNDAGKTFENAALTLVAGDVNVAQNYVQPYPMYAEIAKSSGGAPAASDASRSVIEQKLFEYHSYAVPGAVTLRDNEEKQIALLNSPEFEIKKVLSFNPSRSTKVEVTLEFANSKSGGLGMPLPKGVVRVYTRDASGGVRLIGEDSVEHTAENEDVKLAVGDAFDLTAEKTEKNQNELTKCSSQSDYDVVVRNAGSAPAVVKVVEDSQWGDWEIVSESITHSKKDAHSVEWLVSVPAKSGDANGGASGTTTLSYSIRRSWC